MSAARVREALSVLIAVAAVACGGSGSEPAGPGTTGPSAVTIVSGNGQVGLVGTALSVPLVVKVSGTTGAIAGTTVAFAVASGAATVSPTSATTDVLGQAKTQVTLGSSAGTVVVTATVPGTSLSATFSVSAGTSTVTLACSKGAATTPSVGGVQTGIDGTGICLGGGSSGAEYALVAFYANPDSSQVASVNVRTTGGVTGVSSASLAPSLDATSVVGGGARYRTNNVQSSFEARLRDVARRNLTPKIPAARAWSRQRSASFATVPANPAIGSLVTLNANAQPGDVNACDIPLNITARVAAVSQTAIVVADTANPAGGFTDAEYQSFATTFDTLVSPLDVANFGAPSDIDKNGKTIIFFTKEVNRLTPRGSAGRIGGFFFERDLFPTTATQDLVACRTSNVAEMYYSLVPDPAGRYSDAVSKQSVQDDTPGTLAHEFQHLINAGRRLYVNNATGFEDTWLNEGLSHVAEELLYYHVANLAPRQNINAATVTRSTASVNAFNNYQSENTGRYKFFLKKPNATSVYAGNDSLETRGATWSLLRYLADHQGTSDGTFFFKLVNSATSGQANLARVVGSNYMTQIRDWATSVLADDLAGQTNVQFSQPSWNYRDIFPHLVDGNGIPLNTYPLTVFPVSDAAPASVSVFAGGAAYFRFFVPANGSGSIDWSSGGLPVSPLVQFTVVRSR
ncbi:MAG: Peptidase hyicolysin [Gemmatimonadetes bacterium]|nr:Peptidase hyicolysin [Gemmatimonadota bacterium]